MFTVGIDGYSILVQEGSLPSIYSKFKKEAVFSEECRLGDEGELLFVGIQKGKEWPRFCVALRYESAESGFSPSVLLIPEHEIVFVGAGESIFSYDFQTPRKIWQESVACGFWGWYRFGDIVLMASELEFAAWTTRGKKLWSMFVEPPWDFKVSDSEVFLDIMGKEQHFSLEEGPV